MSIVLPDQASPAVHLVRHGQSSWNVDRLLQGQVEHPPLTALGRAQTRRAARALAGSRAGRLLTSDLRRARESAEIIGAATGLTPIETTLLREVNYGPLQGMTSSEAGAEWERIAATAVDESGDPLPIADLRMPGGESMRDVLARVSGLLAGPWITEATGDVILVSHGDTIRIVIGHLLGEDLDDLTWRDVGNGEVHSIYRTSHGQVVHIRTDAAPTTVE